VDVVEHERQRVSGGEPFREAPPRVEELLAADRADLAGADEGAELRHDALVAEELAGRGPAFFEATSAVSSSKISQCALIASAKAE
jgi:hypothetical protein